jgi:hypothetical protein
MVEGEGSGIALMDKTARGNASQFFIAGQLCRMGYSAVVTLGNTPNTDILCSNVEGTKFVHIQVKTYVPGIRTAASTRSWWWVAKTDSIGHSSRNSDQWVINNRRQRDGEPELGVHPTGFVRPCL